MVAGVINEDDEVEVAITVVAVCAIFLMVLLWLG